MIWDDVIFFVRWIVSRIVSSNKWFDRHKQGNLWNWHKSNCCEEFLKEFLKEFIYSLKAGNSRLVIYWIIALNIKTNKSENIFDKILGLQLQLQLQLLRKLPICRIVLLSWYASISWSSRHFIKISEPEYSPTIRYPESPYNEGIPVILEAPWQIIQLPFRCTLHRWW
jgi:hypothetical protein